MDTPKPISFSCKNYYALSEAEVDEAISKMREWLWKFNGHEQYSRVLFALDVALCAKETYQIRQEDPWIQEVLDFIC